MTELYLIAHVVRSEPAFDIALQIPCPECHSLGCPECDEEGFWWVVPTSGHRAYPYWNLSFYELIGEHEYKGYGCNYHSVQSMVPSAPSGWPDHYLVRASPTSPKTSLADLMAKAMATSTATASPIRRRV